MPSIIYGFNSRILYFFTMVFRIEPVLRRLYLKIIIPYAFLWIFINLGFQVFLLSLLQSHSLDIKPVRKNETVIFLSLDFFMNQTTKSPWNINLCLMHVHENLRQKIIITKNTPKHSSHKRMRALKSKNRGKI